MFTGDASGRFLYQALHRLGLSNKGEASHLRDGLRLNDTYITAVVRCAPPRNRPTLTEIGRCSRFVGQELEALPNLRAIVALGRIAHDGYLRLIGERLSSHPFGHGNIHRPAGGPILIDSYHPSQQNTLTGRLTMPMFMEVISNARRLARLEPEPRPLRYQNS